MAKVIRKSVCSSEAHCHGPAAAFGIAALPRRRLGLAVAATLALTLLASDALAYRVALVAPVDRLQELATIDARFAGRGPLLVNEYEEYTKHYVRRARGSRSGRGRSGSCPGVAASRVPRRG